jgi:hypothetical protein
MNALKKQAHVAGALYLLVAVTAPLGLMYVPAQLFDASSAALTAERIRGAETLLRWGMASEFFHQAVEVFLVMALYQLFQPVNPRLARQMVWLGLIPIPIVFLNVLNEVAALMLARGADFLNVFDRSQLDALALLFVKLHGSGLQVAAVFWGLWLIPLARLVWHSGFIPKLVAVAVMAAGVGYLLGSVHSLLAPGLPDAVANMTFFLELGEPVLILWLVLFGVKAVNGPSNLTPAPLPCQR